LTSKSVGRVRWIIAGLLFVDTVLNFLDLETLSVVAPILTKLLNIGNIQYARINQVFEVGYLIGFVLGGWLIDRLGVRWGLAFAIIWWSIAELAHGSVGSARGLMYCRFLLGLTYPGAYVAASKAAAVWFRPEERGLVTGIYTAGATVGATVAPPLVAWLALSYGWQYAFFVPGSAGLVFLVCWLLFYYDPEHHRFLSEPERQYILSGRGEAQKSTPPFRESLSLLLRSRFFWAIFLGKMVGDPPFIFYVYWMPKFLNESLGLDMRAIGFVAWVPFLFADLGSIGGGWLSGRLVRWGVDPFAARLKTMLGCAAISMFAFTIYFVHSTALAIGLMSLMMAAIMGWMVNTTTVVLDVFPEELVSMATGLCIAGTVLGQIIFTYAIGRIVQAYSYGPLFFMMSIMAPAAYTLIRLIVRNASSPQPNEPLAASM
jgi:MFS transporter, ACS family, hexuronate transporter